MIQQKDFLKALDSVSRCKHELGEIYSAIGTMTGPLNIEDPIEKAEMDALFQASDGVKHAQSRLAAVCDKLLTAVTVPAAAKV